MTRRAGLAGAALLLVVVVAVVFGVRYRRGQGGRSPAAAAPARRVRLPHGLRVRVQVLNATRTSGLARRAMLYLRDQGFDVVESGNAPSLEDSVIVIDRSNHPEWARLVARAFEHAAVVSKPDSSRYLDVTVLVGASWSPPSEPFYP